MAVLKTTWTKLLKNNILSTFSSDLYDVLFNSDIAILCQKIETEINNREELSTISFSALSRSLSTVKNKFFNKTDDTLNIWNDMPIFVSSYKLTDTRFFDYLYDKLFQYLSFYLKALTDNGFAKKIVRDREYSDSGTQNDTTKGYNSETPQIELTNFEEGIKYASSLNKSTNDGTSSREGSSRDTETGVSFEESLKNTYLLYYNDLVDFIRNIPNKVYSHYALETIPTRSLTEMYFKSIKEMFNLEN